MITKEMLERLCPTHGLNPKKYNLVAKRDELVSALNEFLPQYQINTAKRVRAALSVWGFETDHFRTTEEYASGAAYEGRKDLGNTQAGDGKLFKGRGITQTTGRSNYEELNKSVGAKYNVDLTVNPYELGSNIRLAVESACIFWSDNNINAYADREQIQQINGVINRGNPNKIALDLKDRLALYDKAKHLIPDGLVFTLPAPDLPTKDEIDTAQNRFDVAQATLQRPSIKTVGKKLAIRGGLSLASIWSTTSGKVAIVLTSVAISVAIGYFLYTHRKFIQLGYQIFKRKVGLS